MKEKLFVTLLCLSLLMPLCSIGAQDEPAAVGTSAETGGEQASPGDTPQSSAPQAGAPQGGALQSGGAKKSAPQSHTLSYWINKITGYVSQIGNLFGKTTGKRIGGTSISAIAMLVIAKLVQDRAPSWVKYLLYASGGTMIAGSGANITQMIMRTLGI
jgi:hypothetical protein